MSERVSESELIGSGSLKPTEPRQKSGKNKREKDDAESPGPIDAECANIQGGSAAVRGRVIVAGEVWGKRCAEKIRILVARRAPLRAAADIHLPPH